MKKYNILIVLFLSVLFFSCKKEGYKAPVSNTVNMAGRWQIELFGDNDQNGIIDLDIDDYYIDYSAGDKLVTSNTAADGIDSLIVDDADIWPFRIKAPINYSDLTFKTSTVLNINEDYLGSGETVNIIEGKILKGAAHSKSGAVADSIFMEFEFSDDLGTYYIYSGHRDSGQPEDQY